MKAEPLKGKMFETMRAMYSTKQNPYGEIDAFRKEDVASAVEWLKGWLPITGFERNYPAKKIHKLIDEAFEDVVKEEVTKK